MTSLKLDLDPEVEALLQEIASDPRSKLLRVNRPASVSLFAETRPSVGVATAGLTKAERHLVQTRREEFLRFAISHSLSWLADDEPGAAVFGLQRTNNARVDVASDADDWLLENSLSIVPDITEKPEGSSQHRHLARISRGQQSVSYLTMAHRLAPSPHGMIHMMGGYIGLAQFKTALGVGGQILESPQSNWIRSLAFSNIALACYEQGRTLDALAYYKSAMACWAGNIMARISAAAILCDLGDLSAFSACVVPIAQEDQNLRFHAERALRSVRSARARGEIRRVMCSGGER